jgi:zinc protease
VGPDDGPPLMSQETQKVILSNGFTILLHEEHKAPVVSMNLWVHTGSNNETPKEAGISHLIEHMFFKGTKKRAVGEIAKTVEAHGGDINAYTSFEETVYYINMASRYYPMGLEILSDALQNSTIDPNELKSEKEVIVEEISRSEDSPTQMVGEHLFSTAFDKHPFKNPIAGTRESVRAMTRQQIFGYMKKWYVAKNMTLVVVGDFETKKILPLIKKYYAAVSPRKPAQARHTKEPPQKKPKTVSHGMSIEGNYLELGYHIPGALHKDVPVLDLLSHVAGGSESSRLDQIVRKKLGLVSSIYTFAYTPNDPCLFIIGAIVPGKHAQKPTQAIIEILEGFITHPPSTGELARAKTNIKSGHLYEKETVEGVARKIGFFHSVAGDHNFEKEYYQRIEAVTAQDIQAIAKKYFHNNNLTVALCHPKGNKAHVTAHSLKNNKVKRVKKAVINKDSRLIRLDNGVRLILKPNTTNALISLRSTSMGGLRWEDGRNNGINQLIATMLTNGTSHRTSLEIAEHDESIAGHLDGYAGRHLFGLKSSFPSESTSDGLNLFSDVLLNPTFPADELEKEKADHLTAIRNQEDSLATYTIQQYLKKLFPKHPYGMPVLGTIKTIQRLKSKDLKNYYQKWLRPDNLVLAIAGDFDPDYIIDYFRQKLGSLPRQKGPLPKIASVIAPKKMIRIINHKDKFQAHIVYGFLGTTIYRNDRHAFNVLNTILSGQGGRLFLNLRDQQSLAYAISASSQEGLETGYMAVYIGTDPQKAPLALKGIESELQKITTQAVSKEELNRAKNYLIGTYELELQKNSSLATTMAFNEILGLGYLSYQNYTKKIAQVTTQDILKVAQKYLSKPPVIAITQPK